MMSDELRQKAFWLLKKYSSYTAWKALGDAFQKFTNAWEYAVKHEKNADEFEIEALKMFWEGCEEFDKGLPRLKRGERGVFLNKRTANLSAASAILDYANRIMNPREYVFDWMLNKKEVLDNFSTVSNLSGGLSGILERDDRDDSACFGSQTIFHEIYEPFNFPAVLTEVPPPTEVVVSTGDIAVVDGIWEPEWEISPANNGMLSKLTGLITGQSRKLDKGCMNYLLSGTIAPPYQDSMDFPVIPVRWRLIWEDKRYRDGVIPEEEKEYLAASAPVPAAPATTPFSLRGETGEIVPKSGWWISPALQDREDGGRRHFKEGDRFPQDLHTTSWGMVIWSYDPNQE